MVSAKTKCNTFLDYRRLKRFDVLKINDEEKLIVPLKQEERNIQYYVTNEELFRKEEHVCLNNCKLNTKILRMKFLCCILIYANSIKSNTVQLRKVMLRNQW